jgi:glycosyltransferase involved in cell wall biosynthesis
MRSVVVATFQGECFIQEQLHSILGQLADDDEVVVSDDASTDSTILRVNELADTRVRVLANRTRVGYVRNFERAIAASRGQVIYFSDQDDIWLPSKVLRCEEAISQRPCIASDATVVDEKLRVLHDSYFRYRRTRGFGMLAMFLRPPIIGATMACRADYLRALLPFPAGVPHDFWLSVCAARDHALGIIDAPLILYRRHTQTASVTAQDRRQGLSAALAQRWRLAMALRRRRPPGSQC